MLSSHKHILARSAKEQIPQIHTGGKIHKVRILTRWARGQTLPKYTCQSYDSRGPSGNWGYMVERLR